MTAIPTDVLSWVGQAVIGGTLAAVLAWAMTASVLRRARPVFHAAIWTVVLLKFVVPVGPGSKYSLSTALDFAHDSIARPQADNQPTAEDAALANRNPGWVFMADPSQAAALIAPAPLPAKQAWTWAQLLAGAYLAAVALIGAKRYRDYRRFARQCRLLPTAENSVCLCVADICRRESVRRVPTVKIMDDAPAPFVFGAWRPTLVLSRRQLVRPDELEAVVLHEIAHLRRGDLFVRYLQWCAGTLLFFWPVVAWVNRRIDLARETACDEWALRRSRLSAGDYARCLLRALHPPGPMPAYRPAAMAANLKSVERRIEMIMETPNRTMQRGSLTALTALGVAVWAAFVLAGAASARMASDEKKPAEEPKAESVTVQVEGEEVVITTTGEEAKPAEIRANVIRLSGRPGETQTITTGQGTTAGRRMFVAGTPLGDGPVTMAFVCDEMSAKTLAEFLKTHPTADANVDGKLTAHEMDAFLVARAIGSPAETLKQFPQADRNKDSKLSTDEAVRLVAMPGMGGGMQWLGAKPGECATVAAEGGNVKTARAIAIARPAGSAGPAAPAGQGAVAETTSKQHVVVRHEARATMSGDPVQVKGLKMKFTGMAEGSAREWLKKEVNTEPAAAEVARYVSAVESAPQAAFLEEHPESDANKDGKLTCEEQMAFIDKLTAKMLAKHRPDLDADGDGLVSETERGALEKEGRVKVMVRKNVENVNGEVTETESVDVMPDDGSVIPLEFEVELDTAPAQPESDDDGGR